MLWATSKNNLVFAYSKSESGLLTSTFKYNEFASVLLKLRKEIYKKEDKKQVLEYKCMLYNNWFWRKIPHYT